MPKYHVNPETGNPGICRATKRCRFGGNTAHYSSQEEAREAFEQDQEQKLAKAALLEQWGKITWLTKDPMNVVSMAPIEVRHSEEPSAFDPSLLDSDTTKIYEAEEGMAHRVNELLGLPLSTPVLVEDRNDEYWLSEATLEGDHDVTFQAGSKRKTFQSMAAAMQWLAYGDRPSPESIIIPGFSPDGEWEGAPVRVVGNGIVPVIIKPLYVYNDTNSGEALGFYGNEVSLNGKPASPAHRYFSFKSHWVEELKA